MRSVCVLICTEQLLMFAVLLQTRFSMDGDVTYLNLIRVETSLRQHVERGEVQTTRKDAIAAGCGSVKRTHEREETNK